MKTSRSEASLNSKLIDHVTFALSHDGEHRTACWKLYFLHPYKPTYQNFYVCPLGVTKRERERERERDEECVRESERLELSPLVQNHTLLYCNYIL